MRWLMMGERKMGRFSRATGVALSTLFLGGAAQAISFSPNVDFRDSDFEVGHANPSFTTSYGGYGLTLEALKFSGGGLASSGSLYWEDEDGFGVRSASGYEKDEIESNEVLRVSFASSYFVDSILVTDLHFERGYAERGRFSLDGGTSWTWFQADGADPNGEVQVAVNSDASSILFSAPGKTGGQGHEFTVGGLELRNQQYSSAVPEPGAALLFGVGLALLRRRAVRLQVA
jgi:hypothetical protein